jgi:hypothetical protein
MTTKAMDTLDRAFDCLSPLLVFLFSKKKEGRVINVFMKGRGNDQWSVLLDRKMPNVARFLRL